MLLSNVKLPFTTACPFIIVSTIKEKGVKSVLVGAGLFECEFIQNCASADSKMASCAG